MSLNMPYFIISTAFFISGIFVLYWLHNQYYLDIVVKSVFSVKRLLTLMCAATVLMSACTAPKGITVRQAWMRPTAAGENGAIYFVLQNDSSEPDELIEASSNLADAVEMHESSIVAGTDVMQMNQVSSVALDSGSEVTFEPGGLHVMLVGLKKELKVGDVIELTLHFKKHADIPMSVSVAEFALNEHSH